MKSRKYLSQLRSFLRGFKNEDAIIVYRDAISQPIDKKIKSKIGLRVIDVNKTLNDLRSSGIDPSYWKVTNQKGHWNHIAHKAIGKFIAEELYFNNGQQ